MVLIKRTISIGGGIYRCRYVHVMGALGVKVFFGRSVLKKPPFLNGSDWGETK